MAQLSLRHRRYVLATAAVVALGLPTAVNAAVTPRAVAAHQTVIARHGSARVDRAWIKQTNLMNYYPSRNGWKSMWTHWKPHTIQRDMNLTADLGANTIRIITFPYTMGWPHVRPRMEKHVQAILRMAKRSGLQVQLTMFDFWGQYNQPGYSREWTRSLLHPIRKSPQLRFVEVQNEVDLTHAGVVPWIKSEIAAVHRTAPGVPVTVSALHGLGGMISLIHALGKAAPDFWDLHYYGAPQDAYHSFVLAKRAAAPRQVLVGEGGLSTDPRTLGVPTMAQADDSQAQWFDVVDSAARALHLAPVAPWTLFDFSPHGNPYHGTAKIQFHFGLFRVNRGAKPAAAVVSQAFTRRLHPHVLNPGFVPLHDGSRIPAQWHPYYRSGSMGVVRGAGVNGSNAVEFSGTSYQSGGASSFYAIPMEPVLHNQTWSAAVLAKGVKATGTTDLQLSWYDAEGRWLGNSSSANLARGTSHWHLLHLSAKVPRRAAAVRVYIASSANSGRAYFSTPSWSVS